MTNRYWLVFLLFCSAGDVQAKSLPDALAQAHEGIASLMKDPSSAQFKAEAYKADAAGDVWVICGQVNAKNAYGGYVGFRPYYFEIKDSTAEIRDPDDARNFDIWWKLYCDTALPAEAAAR